MKPLALFYFLLLPFISSAQFKNSKLIEIDDNSRAIVPTVAINKSNPKNIVVGVAQHLIRSPDGGISWQSLTLKSSFGAGSDPVLTGTHKGTLFFFQSAGETGAGQVVCHRSDDEGVTWTEGTFLGNQSKNNSRVWPVVHPHKIFLYLTWTQFDQFGNSSSDCQSQIMFSKSPNGSVWSKPLVISQTAGDCLGKTNSAAGAQPTIGSDGKIYVAWATDKNIYFDRSFDNGTTWLDNDLVIASYDGKRDFSLPGLTHSNTPTLLFDNSEGRFKGTMHLVWEDQKKGSDNTDVWLIRSRNRGDYWGKPQKVNQDTTHAHQFAPQAVVDQTSGHVYIVYYDQREYNDNQIDVYLAYSFDGGNNFKEVKISESSFQPDETHPLRCATGIDAHSNLIFPVWTRTDSGHTSIWGTLIKVDELKK
ncbi:MAG: exo-alpha-sialidase [Bacteroidetes bacterium]|nr:exo-alpha-sialidase [Bacteroidota bacterium]